MLDVSDSQESKDAIVKAFEYSKQQMVPVIVRSTSRVAHGESPVETGPIRKVPRKPHLARDISVFTRASPVWCKQQHTRLIEKTRALATSVETDFNKLKMKRGQKQGVVASGVSWNYLMDVLARCGVDVATLKIGSINPLPVN